MSSTEQSERKCPVCDNPVTRFFTTYCSAQCRREAENLKPDKYGAYLVGGRSESGWTPLGEGSFRRSSTT